MRKFSRILIITLLLFVALFVVSCTSGTPGAPLTPLGILGQIWDKIISIARLDFLIDPATKEPIDGVLGGLMRLVVGILVFAVLFGASHLAGGLIPRNIAIVVSLAFAVISVISIPTELFAAIGASYATVVAFILIAVPTVGIGAVVYFIPNTHWGYTVLKVVLLLLLFVILSMISGHVNAMLHNVAVSGATP